MDDMAKQDARLSRNAIPGIVIGVILVVLIGLLFR